MQVTVSADCIERHCREPFLQCVEIAFPVAEEKAECRLFQLNGGYHMSGIAVGIRKNTGPDHAFQDQGNRLLSGGFPQSFVLRSDTAFAVRQGGKQFFTHDPNLGFPDLLPERKHAAGGDRQLVQTD